jgi:hypothetical protein
MPSSSRRLAYAALMVAVGLAGAYAESIPNFEVLTLVAFGSGVLLGAADGTMVGALTMLVYSLLNPYGPAHPLVTLAQVVGMSPAGALGGGFARLGLAARPAAARAASLALCALLLTPFFDLVTNLATGVVFGQPRIVLLQAIPYALWHTGTNVALFVALGTPLSGVLAHYRARLSS